MENSAKVFESLITILETQNRQQHVMIDLLTLIAKKVDVNPTDVVVALGKGLK